MNTPEIAALRQIVAGELNVSTKTGIVDKVTDNYVNVRIGHATVLRRLSVIGDISFVKAGSRVLVMTIADKNYVMAQGTFSGSTNLPAGSAAYSLGSMYYDKVEVDDLLERKADAGHSHRYDHLEAVEGTIGGFEITSDTIRSSVGNFAITSNKNATRMVLGTLDDVIVVDGKHTTYRLWAGAADPASAPFRVEKDGSVYASDGTIAGWDILVDKLSKSNVELDPAGQIKTGTGNDVAIMGTTQGDWRLWIGHADPAFAPFRVNKYGEVWIENGNIDMVLESDDYDPGVRGWHLDSSGWAEFGDVRVRGKIESTVFVLSSTSGISGQMVVSIGATLIADVADTDETIDVDSDGLSMDDLIHFKPDATRSEWMRITTSGTPITGGYRYAVARNLNEDPAGPFDFERGTACMRKGTATDVREPETLGAGEERGAFGALQPGGSGSTSAGGWIVLDGEAVSMSVVTRSGPVYNQYATTVRIGNLAGVLDYETETWGVFIGNENQYLAYDPTGGMRMQFVGAAYDTSISGAGFETELAALILLGSSPSYADQRARLWFVNDTGTLKIKARMKDGATEDEITLADSSSLVMDFLGLTDTPSSYSGQAGKYVRVNSTPNALEFAEVQTGWGYTEENVTAQDDSNMQAQDDSIMEVGYR